MAVANDPGKDMPLVSIKEDDITVSGISAGGFAAVQLHVAFSKTFRGAGIVAGGPFWCAQNNIVEALTACMADGNLISSDYLVQIVRNTAATGFADDPSHLLNDRVWLFSGTKDTVVDTDVVRKAQRVYQEFLRNPEEQMHLEANIQAEHSMITLAYGNKCGFLGEPYLNLCRYDGAGAILQYLFHNSLTPPSNRTMRGTIHSFSQAAFYGNELLGAAVGMAPKGYVYVPPQCANASQACPLHVALHGCLMTSKDIGQKFVLHSGYIPWADENGFIVMFPQAMANLLNPKGCFDWWGYAGTAYASNVGTQTLGIKWMMEALMQLPLTPNTTKSSAELEQEWRKIQPTHLNVTQRTPSDPEVLRQFEAPGMDPTDKYLRWIQ